MPFQGRFIFAVLTLGTILACNMPPPVAAPQTPTLSVEQIVQTRVAAIPTDTAQPAPSEAPATATITPLPFLPTPTLTLFFQPTATATPSLAECPIIVTVTDTPKGDVLHVRRCEDNLEYDLPPLAKGTYAVGPNLKFLVYATENGYLYASKIGSPVLLLMENLKRSKQFTAINRGVKPIFSLSFSGTAPRYKLVLYEKKFAQKYLFDVPIGVAE